MVKAIISQGLIRPLEPLPIEWKDGKEVWIDAEPDDDATPDEIARDFAELEEMCATNDPEDEARIAQAILELRHQGKETGRRKMGLAETRISFE